MKSKYDVMDADYEVISDAKDKPDRKHTVLVTSFIAMLAIFLVITLSSCTNVSDTNNIDNVTAPIYNGSQIEVSAYTDSLEVYPSHIITDLGNNSFEFNIDLTDSKVMYYYSQFGENVITYRSIGEDGEETGVETTIFVSNSDKSDDGVFNTEEIVEKTIGEDGTLVVSQSYIEESDAFYNNLANTIVESGYTEDSNKKDYMIGIDGLGYFSMVDIFGDDSQLEIMYERGNGLCVLDSKNNNSIIIDVGENTGEGLPEQIEVRDYSDQLYVRTSRGNYSIKSENRDMLVNLLKNIIPEDKIQEETDDITDK